MRVTVKICGLTSAADAGLAVQAGADLIGFLFDPVSPRWIGGDGPACGWTGRRAAGLLDPVDGRASEPLGRHPVA